MRTFLPGLFLLLSFLPLRAQICINEYLSSNVNGILDEDQEFADWIEIFNKGDNPVDITGYGLSDDKGIPAKWTFPAITLPAYQYLLVFASDKDRKETPLTFHTIIDIGEEWHYYVPDSDIGPDWQDPSFDDSAWPTGNSSFGYSDGDDTTLIATTANSIFIRKEFTITDVDKLGRLILTMDYDDGFVAYINGHEVARSNLGATGEYMAWDRLALSYHEAVMYTGGEPENFEITHLADVLAEGTNIIAIQVHNNLVGSSDLSAVPFLTAGRFSAGPGHISPWLHLSGFGGLHTNFKIDVDFENVYLYNAQGALIDSGVPAEMIRDVSHGRKPDGADPWYFFGIPTPGATNSTPGCAQVLSDTVVFTPFGGMLPAGTQVSLSTKNDLDSIYYTTDGSLPDATDTWYTGPIAINSSRVIRARAIRYNTLPGPVASQTYVTGRDHDLPIVCLSTEPTNLWDEMSGIYAFGPNTPTVSPFPEANYWKDWERPVHMELYDVQGVKQIDQDAGMKIFGGWSRSSDQKSFSIFARKSYGKGSFKYPFFADKPIDKFESLILRNSGNDNMGLQFHDCFMTGLTRNMNIDRQAYQPAAIYLNGEYWGLLNIREKISNNYIAENYLVNADSVNLLEYQGQTIDGNNAEYVALRDYMSIKTTLQNTADYQWVGDRIDIDNFIQYQLTNIYLNNRDWPGNNIKFWNTTAPGSKWRWILYDTDFGFGIWDVNDYNINTLEFAIATNGPEWPNPPWSTLFLRRLLSNTGFRNNFIIQYCDRLNLDFHPDRVNADLDSLQALYDHEILYNMNRWWGTWDEWMWRISNRRTFGQYRPAYCRQHMQSVFQLRDQLNVKVDVSGEQHGYVRLNTIYPRTYPFTGIYFRNIPVKLTAIPKAGYRFVKWEGSVNSAEPEISYNMASAGNFKAMFTPATVEDYHIVINEINYSSSAELDTKDWVELLNSGLTTADLSGWSILDSGVDSGYVFPAGTLMTPGSYLVVCRDLESFRSYFPNVTNAVGDLQCGFGVDGDIVRLFDQDNHLIDAVNYGTGDPWPDNANGTGNTIELKDAALNNALGENWFAMNEGGTPGRLNSQDTATVTGNQYMAEDSGFDCFPNPFRDYTTIRFDVQEPGPYRLEVVDLQGRVIKVLSSESLDPGSYWIDWNGEGAASGGGVYTIRLITNKTITTRKVIWLK